MPTLGDRWLDFRDRLISNRRFQAFASSSPFLRRIAHRHARGLFDLCAGFVYSQILSACVSFDLFERLREGPKTLDQLAALMQLKPDATARLLDAAVALELVSHRSQDRFGLGMRGAALLANPAVSAMIKHHALLYADLQDPVSLLRGSKTGTNLSHFWAYAKSTNASDLTTDQVAAYTTLMSASQTLVADDVLDAYDVSQHSTLLDIGGGDGTFAAKAAERAPKLNVMVFDLPAVADRARARFDQLGIQARAQAYGGDFTQAPLPTGADLISLVRVLHDHDDKNVNTVLSAVRRALSPGGTVLIAEPIAGTRGAKAMGDAYFGFYLMAMGSGRPRTFEALSQHLHTAGFQRIRSVKTRQPLQTSLLAANC